jgi:hypothetical protein
LTWQAPRAKATTYYAVLYKTTFAAGGDQAVSFGGPLDPFPGWSKARERQVRLHLQAIPQDHIGRRHVVDPAEIVPNNSFHRMRGCAEG